MKREYTYEQRINYWTNIAAYLRTQLDYVEYRIEELELNRATVPVAAPPAKPARREKSRKRKRS